MTKREFIKDEARSKRKKFNPVGETTISKPRETFDLDSFSKRHENNLILPVKKKETEPAKKVYGTVRLLRQNVHRVNALQNALEFDTQDDLIAHLLDMMEKDLDTEKKIMFDMYMKTYLNRDKKKKK